MSVFLSQFQTGGERERERERDESDPQGNASTRMYNLKVMLNGTSHD